VFYSDFYPNEDFEVILYLGKDYYKYFDLKWFIIYVIKQ
jgi:hypothetical protein